MKARPAKCPITGARSARTGRRRSKPRSCSRSCHALLLGTWEGSRMIEVATDSKQCRREGARQAASGQLTASQVQTVVTNYLQDAGLPTRRRRHGSGPYKSRHRSDCRNRIRQSQRHRHDSLQRRSLDERRIGDECRHDIDGTSDLVFGNGAGYPARSPFPPDIDARTGGALLDSHFRTSMQQEAQRNSRGSRRSRRLWCCRSASCSFSACSISAGC